MRVAGYNMLDIWTWIFNRLKKPEPAQHDIISEKYCLDHWVDGVYCGKCGGRQMWECNCGLGAPTYNLLKHSFCHKCGKRRA